MPSPVHQHCAWSAECWFCKRMGRIIGMKALESRDFQKPGVYVAWSASNRPAEPLTCLMLEISQGLPRQTRVSRTAFLATSRELYSSLPLCPPLFLHRPSSMPPGAPGLSSVPPHHPEPMYVCLYVPYSIAAKVLTLQHRPRVWLRGNPQKPVK